jgi:hypothetical protein
MFADDADKWEVAPGAYLVSEALSDARKFAGVR